MRITSLLTVAVSMIAGPALAEIDVLSVTFTCENNTVVPVTYFNPTEGPGAAAMMVDGQLIPMKQTPSGSGISYQSVDTQGVYTLRSKGWDATISFQAEGSTAPEQVMLRDCRSR